MVNRDKKAQSVRGLMGGPGGPSTGLNEKPKNFRLALSSLISYLGEFKFHLLVVVLFSVVSTVFVVVSPRMLGDATNQIVDDFISMTAYDRLIESLPEGQKLPPNTTGSAVLGKMSADQLNKMTSQQRQRLESLSLSQRPEFDFAAIRRIIVILLVLYLLSALFGYFQGWMTTGISQKVTYALRRDISKKVNRLPLSYFDKTPYGEVLSRSTNDIETIAQSLGQSLSQIITAVVTIVGTAAMMLSISWPLTVVAIMILPLSFGLVRFVVKRSQLQFVKQQQLLGELNGHIEEMYGGHLVVRVFNGQQRSVARFNKINQQLYHSAWRSQFYSGLMFPMMTFVGNLGFVAVAAVGGWLAILGHLRIGDIQAFIQYVQQFNQPIAQTANIASTLQSTAAAAERVFEFLDQSEELRDRPKATLTGSVKGRIVFDQVVFGYDPKKPVINQLSAVIEPGSRVAIVGPTGAGKTTLVNLLMRFYDVDSGSITIDDIDIAGLKRSEVRQLFGMVLQDTWLFHGTIEDNITYGMPKLDTKRVAQVAEAVQIDHFIRSMPAGYQMELNEEADNISVGEKQLLTIARTMLADRPMLILDEATSSVDTRTELLIQQAMDRLLSNKTSFVIAHRLSTIRQADLILVMRDGDVVEQGTHQQLMNRDGFYASLYTSQFAD